MNEEWLFDPRFRLWAGDPIVHLERHGITTLDGATWIAPMGTPPPDESVGGQWVEYLEPLADLLETGRMSLEERMRERGGAA